MTRQNAGRALTAVASIWKVMSTTRPCTNSENNVAGCRRLQLGCWGGCQSEHLLYIISGGPGQ